MVHHILHHIIKEQDILRTSSTMRTTFELKLPVKYYDQDIIIFGNLYQALHDQEKIALLLLSAKIEPSHTE